MHRPQKQPLFRRSPYIVAAWIDGKLVFHNYATGKRVASDPFTCVVLDAFNQWQPVKYLVERLEQYSVASIKRAILQLAQHSLLQRSDRPQHPIEKALHRWGRWNPAAGFFHFSTKDLPYQANTERMERLLRSRAAKLPMPPPIKQARNKRTIALPAAARTGEFPRVLLARRTWRNFSPEAIDLERLSTLLKLTFGVQGWRNFLGLGRLALKTSPSGGARHPIEAYLIVRRVNGLNPGLYHYVSHRHELEQLSCSPAQRTISNLIPAQSWCRSAAAIIVMTAVFERTQWKYDFPRAYRAVLLDAGHICQTLCLTATWLGLAPFCTMALADSKIERALQIDGISEGVIYAAGVGIPPRIEESEFRPD